MNYLTTCLSVHFRSTFKGFGCPHALYIFALAWLFGAAQVCSAQTGQETTAKNALHTYHVTRDPHYINATARLPEILGALDALKAAVTAAQTVRPGQFTLEFENCLKVIDRAIRRANVATRTKDFGSVNDLISTDPTEDGSRTNITACLTALNGRLGRDLAIEAAANRLNAIFSALDGEMEQIDKTEVAKKAAAEYRRIGTQGSCEKTDSPENIEFQREGYTVKTSRVDNPFDFLPWVKIKVDRVKAEIAALVDGKPFLYATAVGQALAIIENEGFLPVTSDASFQFLVQVVTVENCTDAKTIDLVYRIYSTQILPVLSGTPEARVIERQTPQTTAGLIDGKFPSFLPVQLTPTAGYDSTNKLF